CFVISSYLANCIITELDIVSLKMSVPCSLGILPVFASCNKILSGSNVGMFKPSYYFMILFSFANSATDGASFLVVPLPVLGVSCLRFSLTAAFTDSSNDFLNSLIFLSVFSALSARRKSANVEGSSFYCMASTTSERKILRLIYDYHSAHYYTILFH